MIVGNYGITENTIRISTGHQSRASQLIKCLFLVAFIDKIIYLLFNKCLIYVLIVIILTKCVTYSSSVIAIRINKIDKMQCYFIITESMCYCYAVD